jgi:Spy/CpxP family protein refolding chaperone
MTEQFNESSHSIGSATFFTCLEDFVMKRQLFAVLAGLALVVAPIVTQPSIANIGDKGGPLMEWVAQQLNLSETQKTQIKAIHEKYKAQRDLVFTPAQKAKIEAAKAEFEANRPQAGGRPDRQQRQARMAKRKEFRESLGLTDAQKETLKSLTQAEMKEVKAILTPEQQQKMEQMKQRMKELFGGRLNR